MAKLTKKQAEEARAISRGLKRKEQDEFVYKFFAYSGVFIALVIACALAAFGVPGMWALGIGFGLGFLPISLWAANNYWYDGGEDE